MSSILKFSSKAVEQFCSKRFHVEYDRVLKKLKVENRTNLSGEAQAVYKTHLKTAQECVTEAFSRYRHEQLALCFDGGKDGHIVLDIVAKMKDFDTNKTPITVLNGNVAKQFSSIPK